jgi:hypothetical protein
MFFVLKFELILIIGSNKVLTVAPEKYVAGAALDRAGIRYPQRCFRFQLGKSPSMFGSFIDILILGETVKSSLIPTDWAQNRVQITESPNCRSRSEYLFGQVTKRIFACPFRHYNFILKIILRKMRYNYFFFSLLLAIRIT